MKFIKVNRTNYHYIMAHGFHFGADISFLLGKDLDALMNEKKINLNFNINGYRRRILLTLS